MRKKSFKSSYSELYLITKDIYNKVMTNITDNADQSHVTELNNTNESDNNPINSLDTNSNYIPDTNLNDIPTKPLESGNVLSKIDELKQLIINTKHETDQTDQTEVSDKGIQTEPSYFDKNIATQTEKETQNPTVNVNTQTTPLVQSDVNNYLPTQPKIRQKPPMKEKKFTCEICQKKFTRIYSKHRHKKTQHKNQTVENTILPSTPAPNTSTTVNSNLSKRKRSEESENEESENAGVKKFRADISGKRKRTDDTQNIGNTSKFFKKWT